MTSKSLALPEIPKLFSDGDTARHIVFSVRLSSATTRFVSDRAAQFSPFAALTGFDAAVDETARYTEIREELTEDEVNKLNDDLSRLLDMLDERPEIRVTYFVPEKRKSGGSYQTKTGIVRIYDSYTNELVFMDKTRIAVEDMCLVEFVEERGKIQ